MHKHMDAGIICFNLSQIFKWKTNKQMKIVNASKSVNRKSVSTVGLLLSTTTAQLTPCSTYRRHMTWQKRFIYGTWSEMNKSTKYVHLLFRRNNHCVVYINKDPRCNVIHSGTHTRCAITFYTMCVWLCTYDVHDFLARHIVIFIYLFMYASVWWCTPREKRREIQTDLRLAHLRWE